MSDPEFPLDQHEQDLLAQDAFFGAIIAEREDGRSWEEIYANSGVFTFTDVNTDPAAATELSPDDQEVSDLIGSMLRDLEAGHVARGVEVERARVMAGGAVLELCTKAYLRFKTQGGNN